MKNTIYTKEKKIEIFNTIFTIDDKYIKYIDKKEIYWIYKITNTINNKVYIGKTNNIKNRVKNYINIFCKGEINNKIDKAINKYGITNFNISILEVAYNNYSADIKEKYYIDLYNSITEGYNINNGGGYNILKKSHTGTKQTLYSKMAKSKLICAINPEMNEFIFSTGLKLFGDYIGRSKDNIKSAAKRETKINGYFIYYLNNTDYNNQISNALSKYNKNSIYSDCTLQYGDFLIYGNILKMYLNNFKNDLIYPKFIMQSSNTKGYDEKSIDIFIKYYSNLDNKII